MRLKRNLRKGFTLVELVVVIAVIAILAAVSVGAYFGVTDSANSSNATAGAKQVKDLWTMYAMSDYEDSKSLEDNAVDFCLRYMPENGPTYDVNYQVVGIKENQQVSNQNNVSRTSGKEGILFKIETNYPTWFLVDGYKVIEQSETYKNQEEFVSSLHASASIDTESDGFIKLASNNYDFSIETLEFEGNKVRGFSFYNISIENSPYVESEDGIHNFYIRKNTSIYDETGLYLPTVTSLGNNVLGNTFKLVDDSNIEVSSQEVIELQQTKLEKIESDDPMYQYGYVIGENIYKYVALNEVNNENFPIAIASFEFQMNSVPFEKENEVDVYNDDGKTGTRTFTGVLKSSKFNSGNITYLQSFDYIDQYVFDKKFNLVFISSCVIDEDVTFPDNTFVVINNETTSNVAMDNLIKKIDLDIRATSNRIEFTQKIKKSLFSWKTDGDAQYDASKFTIENEYINKINIAYIDEKLSVAGSSANTKETFSSNNDIVNSVTITKDTIISFGKNCALIVDGKLKFATSTGVVQVTQRGELINNGTIILEENSYIRAFSKIGGDGTIFSGKNSHVTEIAKFRDYYGGTNASNIAGLKTLFPYMDLILDNIQCTLNLEYGSDYSAVSGMYFSLKITDNITFEKFYPTPEIYLISDEHDALFKYDNNKDDNSHLDDIAVKYFDASKGKIGIILENGIFYDGILNLELSASGIGSFPLSTNDLPFPISNMDITIASGATMNFQNTNGESSSRYELLPTSSLTIEEGGTLNVYNGVEFAVLNYSDFYKMHKDGITSPENTHQIALFKSFRELYESNNFTEDENIINKGTINIGIKNADNTINNGYLYSNTDVEIQIGETTNPDETTTPITAVIQNRIMGNAPIILSENTRDYLFNMYNSKDTTNNGVISFAIKPVKVNA